MGTYTYRGHVIVISPKHSAVLVYRASNFITSAATEAEAEEIVDSLLAAS